MEGLSGRAASHRSVLSEHRSEDDAREAASVERSRLQVIYGENASEWRVLVGRDGEVVHQEIPAPQPDSQAIAGPAPSAVTPPADAEPAPADEDAEGEAAPEPESEPDAPPEPLPEGPVPDWVLAKFEESIARRGEREETPEPPG